METSLEKTFFFGAFELNGAKRLLLKNGETLALNSKTFDLLLFLVENRGQILSKDELLEKVWENQFVEENNLTVQISALRKIFGEKKNANQFIATIQGKGYKFVADVRSLGEKSAQEDSNDTIVSEYALTSFTPPKFQTKLIGRNGEVANIKDLLRQENINLITLTGAGGSGKTSLAKQIAAELKTNFPDGVFFVELAAVTETNTVISAIAQTLRIAESRGEPLFERVKEFLRTRETLLILDNFEQVLAAAPLVKELSAETFSLKMLITSRTALQIENEHNFLVSPLALPPSEINFSPEKLNGFSAIELFCRRASAVRANFVLNAENFAAVVGICRRLDGLPLAIELAAVRVKLLSPPSILERLENSLKLLTGGAKDSPTRQRTMRDAIRWSYDLLDDDEQILFRRLAIFAGGFSVEAAETIYENCELQKTKDEKSASAIPNPQSERQMLDLLDALVDNNLLTIKEQSDGGVRLQMLEVVREFAAEYLNAPEEAELVRRVHSEIFLALAEAAEPHLSGGELIRWLEKLETEHDNLRVALRWLLVQNSEAAARMAVALRHFWINRSYLTEARRWLESALDRTDSAPTATRLKLLNAFGLVARNQGDYATTRRVAEESLAASRTLNDLRQIILSCHAVAGLEIREGNFSAARKLFEEALIISRESGDQKQIAITLSGLGNIFLGEGNSAAARILLEESVEISRRFDFKFNLCNDLVNFGTVAYYEREHEEASLCFAESLKIASEMGNKTLVSCCLDGFAAVAAINETAEQAAFLGGAAESLREAIGYEIEIIEQRFRADYLTKAQHQLGEKKFAAIYRQGQRMNTDETLALLVNGQLYERVIKPGSSYEDEIITEIIIENHEYKEIIIEE